MKIMDDGSVEGKTFSGEKYKGPYPTPKRGIETLRQYRKRVQDDFISKGFHLGDLSWSDWQSYCMGSGYFEGVSSGEYV